MKKLFIILINIAVAANAHAQCTAGCGAKNKLNLSSGINSTGNVLANQSVDPYWNLINVAPPSVNNSGGIQLPNAYAVDTYQSNWNTLSNGMAGILSAVNTSSFGTNNTYSSMPWRFRRQFCVCSESKVNFSGNFRADDLGTVTLKSGTGAVITVFSLSPAMTSGSTSNFTSDHTFSNTLVLSAGTYFIDVNLANTNAIAMGFALNLILTEINGQNSLLNPNTDCCKKNPMISGIAIKDINCSGDANSTDSVGIGWTISLMSGNTTIQTTTTDNNGEFFFNNVSPGSYTINAFNPSNGTSAQISVTVTSANLVTNVIVFNGSNCNLTCCNITGLQVGIPSNVHQNDYGSYQGSSFNININTGTSKIQEIRASIVSFTASYNKPECARCYTPYTTMGTFKLTNTNSAIPPLLRQNLSHYSIGTALGGSNRGVREIVWNIATPSIIGAANPQFEILYPKPILPDCCNIHVKACIKFVFKDADCNICEVYKCFEN